MEKAIIGDKVLKLLKKCISQFPKFNAEINFCQFRSKFSLEKLYNNGCSTNDFTQCQYDQQDKLLQLLEISAEGRGDFSDVSDIEETVSQ
jgi:hypothetical protein